LLKVAAGQSVHVACKAGADGTEVTTLPFKDGKPVDDYISHTAFIASSGVTSGDTFGPWSDGAREIVVRVNKQSATVSAEAVSGGNVSGDFVDNQSLREPSEKACTVLFRIVHADTLQPVMSGFRINLNRRREAR
jgi:hypothetical protein